MAGHDTRSRFRRGDVVMLHNPPGATEGWGWEGLVGIVLAYHHANKHGYDYHSLTVLWGDGTIAHGLNMVECFEVL
jgi:hypothetical protein